MLTSASCAHKSVYGGYVLHDASFDVIEPNLSGASVGLTGGASADARLRGFVQLDVRSDGDAEVDLFDLSFGGLFYAPIEGPIRPALQLGLGVGRADVEGLQNSIDLLTASIGARIEWQITESFGLYLIAGLRGYFDTTDPTTCNDGTTSPSVGQGTCSYHGGIAYYNDHIGDSIEPELGAGLSLHW
ncbi:MAG: hypothetical protein AAF957_03265 [Planctomycetota bacterium]